jgi:predicted nucleotidyltransferase
METIGLSDHELGLMRAVFRRHPEIERVVLYGSRAKGTHRPESDIDLAIAGIDDPLRAEALATELDELPLPYQFDVRAQTDIRSAALREHIERVGVVVYGKGMA